MIRAERHIGLNPLTLEDPIQHLLHHAKCSFCPLIYHSQPTRQGTIRARCAKCANSFINLSCSRLSWEGQDARMLDDIVELLRDRYGAEWGKDTDANIRFAIEAERLVSDTADAHLIGEPELDDHHLTLQFWVDRPVKDLMTADQVAFEIFARISTEIFYSERKFVEGAVVYGFVTGTSRHGHCGSVVLAGPHAAEFSERFRQRTIGGPRFHA